MSPSLAGIHDREGQIIAPPGSWVLDTVALSENPIMQAYPTSLNWIVRLNWGYGSTGTLPLPNDYNGFAEIVQAYVRGSTGCSRWIIGNEPNLSREWPNGHPIQPWHYAVAYRQCRNAIHAVPGRERDEVLISGSGPWNAELKYHGNPNGDWITYFQNVIADCNGEIDGFSLHAYTHGYNVALVTSSARMQAPFQHRHYEFRTYRDYMEAIPDVLSHLPVYITEANGNGPWQAVGLMPAMVNEIDAWNQSGAQPIKCICFYRYPKYDDFYMEGKADVIAEFKAAVGREFRAPVKGKEQMNTHIPVVNPGTPTAEPSLPPRTWDERLTARGVSIETPPLKPGQQYWRVVKARWWNEQESQGRHHIYVEARDEGGNLLIGRPFEATWPSGSHTEFTKGGRLFDAGNFPMSKSLNEFSVGMKDGVPSETLKGIGMGDKGNSGIHTSTGVTFQLATWPAVAVPAQPPQPPAKPVEPVEPTPQPEPAPTENNWTRSRAFVRKWEGDYTDNPDDHGNWTGGRKGQGELKGTKYGISAASYPTLDIPNLTLHEADSIYFRDYWQASGADKLQWPYCLLAFDTAVLHGVGTSRKWQQEVGDNALAFAAKRLRVYTKLDNWNVFGAGWVNRVADLLEVASKP